MSKILPHGTRCQAVVLWLFTNLSGTVGLYLTFAVIGATDSSTAWTNTTGRIEAIISLIAAGVSLPIIPVAVVAFRTLLAFSRDWPRLLATGTGIPFFFLLTVVLAAYGITGKLISLPGMMWLGGWAYLLAALVSAALVYRQELFRPDAPGLPG